MPISRKTKSILTVAGTSLVYFAMGLYFAAGNTGVYLSSYLIYRAKSDMKLDDAIWFLSAAGFSALLLPIGGWLEGKLGVRAVCAIGGVLQSCGILATYFVLDTTFFWVVLVYGGSFLASLASCYTSPMVNVSKWHPTRKGLVTGISAASMAMAPTLFTPLITKLVNPLNLAANEAGLFDDEQILDNTKQSTLIQGAITATLFALGIALIFPAGENEPQPNQSSESSQKQDQSSQQTSTSCSLREKPESGQVVIERELSLEPKFAIKTIEFWLLSLKVFTSELIFIYLLYMYKPYGQTFIQDDYFLSTVGAACAISNTLGRLSMGYVVDKIGYRAVSIPLSAITIISIFVMPLTKQANKLLYGSSVILAIGAVGSQYALMPSAAQDSFGNKYAAINIGLVYMSTVLATISSALLSQHLTSLVGWDAMVMLIAGFATIDLVSTLFMPTNPKLTLARRFQQFYLAQVEQQPKSSTGTLTKCPKCQAISAA